MTNAARTYRELLGELLFEREAAGGELSEEQESDYAERLDDVWWQLSAEERQAIEDEHQETAAPIAAPGDLGAVDVEVEEGSHAAPRRWAA